MVGDVGMSDKALELIPHAAAAELGGSVAPGRGVPGRAAALPSRDARQSGSMAALPPGRLTRWAPWVSGVGTFQRGGAVQCWGRGRSVAAYVLEQVGWRHLNGRDAQKSAPLLGCFSVSRKIKVFKVEHVF